MVESVLKMNANFELVMAWNKPVVRLGEEYIVGFSSAKNHLLILPFGVNIIDAVDAKALERYKVNKKTVQVPVDWKIDRTLLKSLVKARLEQI